MGSQHGNPGFAPNQLTSSATYSSLAYNNHWKNGNQLTFPATYSSLEQKICGAVTIPLPGM
jgi:hypothetical protein